MIKELISLANDLDQKGLRKEADLLDKLIKEAGDIFTFPKYLGGSDKEKAPPKGSRDLLSPEGELVGLSEKRKEKELRDLLRAHEAKERAKMDADAALNKKDKIIFITDDKKDFLEDITFALVSEDHLRRINAGEPINEVISVTHSHSAEEFLRNYLQAIGRL